MVDGGSSIVSAQLGGGAQSAVLLGRLHLVHEDRRRVAHVIGHVRKEENGLTDTNISV